MQLATIEVAQSVGSVMFDDYQDAACEFSAYPDGVALPYLISLVTSEAGEVADKYGKALRDGRAGVNNVPDAVAAAMVLELGDLLWGVAVLADYLGYDLSDVAQLNLSKLSGRKARGTIKGSGDDR